ncbi:MAG: TIGR03905 family TSCPD domain-containing protein [Ruminococcaceae bacterium]|nr:TIGR03905 family TSCPD domain-containing protein [Oscillospiraceae bacterium]
MKYSFRPKGVCSMQIEIEVENSLIKNVEFVGGCSGNTQGVASLAKGRNIDEVIAALEGIKCGFKNTSCPDQLACALKEIKKGA